MAKIVNAIFVLVFLLPFFSLNNAFGKALQTFEAEGQGTYSRANKDDGKPKADAVNAAKYKVMIEVVNKMATPELIENNFKIALNLFKNADKYIKEYKIINELVDSKQIKVAIQAVLDIDEVKGEVNRTFSTAMKPTHELLPPLMTVLKSASFTSTMWHLAIEHRHEDYKAKNKDEVKDDIRRWLESKPSRIESEGQLTKYKLSLENQNEILALIDRMGMIGGDLTYFLTGKKEIPIKYAQKENEIAFLVTDLGISISFSTLRSTAKTRAGKVLSSNILPTLNYFNSISGKRKIKYYGMAVTYGSKDFSNRSDVLNLKAETVALIVSADNLKKFTDGAITDD